VKKSTQLDKPPMLFGGAPTANNPNNTQVGRAKEIQNIYSQKLTQKPPSAQGVRKISNPENMNKTQFNPSITSSNFREFENTFTLGVNQERTTPGLLVPAIVIKFPLELTEIGWNKERL